VIDVVSISEEIVVILFVEGVSKDEYCCVKF